ncbi:MAG: hypothetical protein WAN50_04710 [Minisyncoccia bacterium]
MYSKIISKSPTEGASQVSGIKAIPNTQNVQNANATVTDIGGGWSQYTDTAYGFSFEYPSNEIHLIMNGPAGTSTIVIANNNISAPTAAGNYKNILFTIYPKQFSSVEDFVSFVHSQPSPGFAYPNLKYQIVDNVKFGISKEAPEFQIGEYPNTDVLFYYNKQLWSGIITNLSPDETKRVWQSFKFLNK